MYLLLLAADQKDFDPNTVTPGIIGFIVTFLIAVAAVFLAIDMVRRIRRVNYRQQAQEKIAAEKAAAAAASDESST